MATRRCPQCGATVASSEEVLATSCAFCDSPLVASQDAGEPIDRVVPFEVERARASRALLAYLQSRRWAPEAIRHRARPECLRPVLLPFYVYDAVARTRFSCQVGIYWYRTETYTTWQNGRLVTRTRRVRETEWFPFQGSHGRTWFDHAVSASKGLPVHEANGLLPWDLGRSAPFAPERLAGLEAEHPTVVHEEAQRVAHEELSKLEAQVIARGFLPGDTHSGLRTDSELQISDVRLVLLPVWLATVRTPKGPLRLLVNGQSGRVTGRVPTSPWKVAMGVVAVVLLVLALVAIVLTMGSCMACLGAL